jgi:hypothetical protein
MMGGAFGGHVMSSSSTSSSSSFGNKNHDLVYGIIRQNKDEQGINTGHILAQVFLPLFLLFLLFLFRTWFRLNTGRIGFWIRNGEKV